MTIGVHSFQVPHDKGMPTRDMVVIKVPAPPKKIGRFFVPDQSREMSQHNVMYGLIVKMGPLAFQYKDSEGLRAQDANVGDWVLIRPFAGTLVAGGKLVATYGYRYVSSFQDVISVIPAADMPPASEFEWDGEEADDKPAAPAAKAVDDFSFSNPKETLTLRADQIPSSNHTLTTAQVAEIGRNGPHGI